MKIIFYDYHFLIQKFGGVSRYYYEIITRLKKHNINYKILSFLSFNYYFKKTQSSGFYIYKSKYLKNLFLFINKFYFKFICLILDPKIIHFTEYSDLILKYKKISILTVYDFILENHQNINNKNSQKVLLKEECIKKANYIFTISNTVGKVLKEKYPNKRIFITPLGVNHNNFYNEKISDFTDILIPNKKYILYVGSKNSYKNFNLLLNCFLKNSSINENFNLVLFGGENIINSKIDNNFLNKKIFQIYGGDNLLRKIYSNCSLYINTSLEEGFGLPLVEAMACKSPILCSDINVFREITENSVYYFQPHSYHDLNNKIEMIVNKKFSLDESIDKAYNISLKKNWENVSNSLINFYKVILEENNANIK